VRCEDHVADTGCFGRGGTGKGFGGLPGGFCGCFGGEGEGFEGREGGWGVVGGLVAVLCGDVMRSGFFDGGKEGM